MAHEQSENDERQASPTFRMISDWMWILFLPYCFLILLIEIGFFTNWEHLIESRFWQGFWLIALISLYLFCLRKVQSET